eukprot:g6135.t1
MADDDTIWSNLFLFVDSDGDGKVTTDDMKKVWGTCFGFPDDEITEMMGGDSLDLDGFKAMMKKLKPETTAELAVEAFDVFRSSENTMNCASFTRDMNKGDKPLAKKVCEEFCKHADVEGDGTFKTKEYVSFVMDGTNCVRNAQDDTYLKPEEKLTFG